MGKRICVNRKIHTEDQPHKSQPYYKSKLLPKKKKVEPTDSMRTTQLGQ